MICCCCHCSSANISPRDFSFEVAQAVKAVEKSGRTNYGREWWWKFENNKSSRSLESGKELFLIKHFFRLMYTFFPLPGLLYIIHFIENIFFLFLFLFFVCAAEIRTRLINSITRNIRREIMLDLFVIWYKLWWSDNERGDDWHRYGNLQLNGTSERGESWRWENKGKSWQDIWSELSQFAVFFLCHSADRHISC